MSTVIQPKSSDLAQHVAGDARCTAQVFGTLQAALPCTVFTRPELPIKSESAGKYVAKVSHIRTRFRDQQPS
jgi:hypothetical protein